MAIDEDDLLDCFLNLPASEGVPSFVLDYKTISKAQAEDAPLVRLRETKPQWFAQQLLAPETQVVCYMPTDNAPWKIYLPMQLLKDAVKWYHLALGHLGQTRLYDSMSLHFLHPDLKTQVENIVSTCDPCQRYKQVLRGHGHTAGREAATHPWRNVAVDLIGPWTLVIQGSEVEFRALTVIDTVTNLGDRQN
jgi:hypothetical protein